MSELIIGYGQIGKAIQGLVPTALHIDKGEHADGDIFVMHICIPYSETFLDTVREYIKIYQPEHIIIWSTVPVGTTKKLYNAIHSPVEGVHPHLLKSIKTATRWIGVNTIGDAAWAYNYFIALGLVCRILFDSNHTEVLKLISTTEYGVNIVFADYKKQVADSLGMDYELMKEWNLDYNQLYRKLSLGKKYQKYVLDPPNGKIGGHCIKPNADILDEQYPNIFIRLIKEMEDAT